MILCNQRKIAIFTPPKTGSISLTRLFSNRNIFYVQHNHYTHNTLLEMSKLDSSIGDLDKYSLYCFYREPLERSLSMIKHIKRTECHRFFHAVFGNEVKISCLSKKNYTMLSDELKRINDSVSLIETFRKMKRYIDDVYAKQVVWLNHANIQMLDFRNFESETKKLMQLFDIDLSTEIPFKNRSITIPELDYLSESETQEIKDYYTEDYDFFASKGIVFGP